MNIPKQVATGGLDVIGRVIDIMKTSNVDSLPEFTQSARVEPTVLMDNAVRNHEYATDIMKSLTSLFTAYYLQAVSLSTNIGAINVLNHLDRFNPKRDLKGNAFHAAGNAVNAISMESYDEGLPDLTVSMENRKGMKSVASERIRQRMNAVTGRPKWQDNLEKELERQLDESDKKDKGSKSSKGNSGRHNDVTRRSHRDTGTADKDYGVRVSGVDKIDRVDDLSVGKMVEVVISDNGHKATIPVSVRLMVKSMAQAAMVSALTAGQQKGSAKERYHAWRAGELDFWRDLVMCQDVIDKYKTDLKNDTAGVYRSARNRKRSNRLSGALTGTPSVAGASSIVVISESTANALERAINGRLSDFRRREALFKETFTMLMVVVDMDYDQVTIYHRSIAQPSELSVRELRASNRGNGPDIGDILKAYQIGKPASF